MTTDVKLFIALLALPLVVAMFEFGWFVALMLVLVWLVLRWGATLQGLMRRGNPEIQLDTIAVSHFVEKVRWCLDRADIPYKEHQSVGSMGAFFTGRSVPRLRVHTGAVTTSIGNSPEILRYLWGRYAHEAPEKRAFLAPTPERVAFEQTLDRYGVNLQVWVYSHMLKHPEKLDILWGLNDPNTPAFQRAFGRLVAPLLRTMIAKSFRITPGNVEKAKGFIEKLLADTESRLAQNGHLVDETRSFVDYAFAGISSLWLQPEEFGGGAADNVRLGAEDMPDSLIADANEWKAAYPLSVEFMQSLYRHERRRTAPLAEAA
ncbi:MAG: glutathione S-transferase family protein [Pseudomonadota bacterium]